MRWLARQALNLEPPESESGALPVELHANKALDTVYGGQTRAPPPPVVAAQCHPSPKASGFAPLSA